MPFKSDAQRRFAFATKQPWAKKWADETPKGADLPEKVAAEKGALRRLAKKKGKKGRKE
jgi:hypothetical protein